MGQLLRPVPGAGLGGVPAAVPRRARLPARVGARKIIYTIYIDKTAYRQHGIFIDVA